MPVKFTTLNRPLNVHLSADTMRELAPVIAVVVCPASGLDLVARLDAGWMAELADALTSFARQLDEPDRISAIRVDEERCYAELTVAPRPVDVRRMH